MLKAIAAVAALALVAAGRPDQECTAAKVDKLPVLDGKADDAAWGKAKELLVKIDKTENFADPKEKCTLKVVHDGDSACFLLVWEDKGVNDKHYSFVWKADKGEYEEDENEMEDAATLAFGLEGKFDPDMRVPADSKWDVWEWRAARANKGFARDRHHVYSKTRIENSKRLKHPEKDVPVFMARLDDAGTPCVKQVEKPGEKKGERVDQFVPQAPSGSCADVAAVGVWAGNKWTVEFKRKLKTGNPDDVVFEAGKAVEAAVALFDNTEKSDHSVSNKIILKFE